MHLHLNSLEPLLRGHSDKRSPLLEKPVDNVYLTINVLISTHYQRSPLVKGHISGAGGVLMPRLQGAKIIWITIRIVIQKMNPFTQDIHCSLIQRASHCCSLFSHCYITIHLISGLKLSRSSVFMGQICFDPDLDLDCDPDNFAPCKRVISSSKQSFSVFEYHIK